MLALLKLQNGTEVIGNVREDQETKVVLEDPLQINYLFISTQPMPTVSVSRYMPFASDKIVTFEKKNLLHVVKPKQAMIEYYNHALNNYKVVIDKNIESLYDETSTSNLKIDNTKLLTFLQINSLDSPKDVISELVKQKLS